MTKRLLLGLWLLALSCGLLAQAPPNDECGANEKFTDCLMPCFQPNCTYWPGVCPTVCQGSGCVCDDDFLRGPDGACIAPEDCPEVSSEHPIEEKLDCLPNEKYTVCYNACEEANCTYTPPANCPRDCQGVGCICEDGLVRDFFDQCVEPDECHQQGVNPNHT